ncbi:MAG: hypothetical protein WAJ87_22640 [Bryobacteraceae bacterium]
MNIAKPMKVAQTGAKWFGATVITAILASLVTAWLEGKELKGAKDSIPVLWHALLAPAIPVWMFSIVLVVALAGLPKLTRRRERSVDLRMVSGPSTRNAWGIGAYDSEPTLVLSFTMSFAHRESNLSLVGKKIYLEGTEPVLSLQEIVVTGPYGPEESIHLILRPVIATPGKALKGRVVLVDQFGDKHVSDRIVFMPRTSPLARSNTPPPQSLTCLFCHQTIALEDLAREAEVPAHQACIWKPD